MKQNLTETITLLNRALALDFRLMPLATPDSPVFLAVAWPQFDGVTGLKPRLPAGRGLTPQQALVAAGAEALELRASLAQNHMPDLASLPRANGLAMAPAVDLLSGDSVPVLAQEVYLDCAATLSEPLHVDARSTGCAAGASRTSAKQAGLWECIERDALALWWHGRVPPTAVPLAEIDRQQPRLFWWLSGRDRQTRLLDVTTDIGLPVVAAVSCDPDGLRVAVGSAARPERKDAALAAVTEMVQAEVSMEEARRAEDPELLAWDAFASTRSLPQFQPTDDRRTSPANLDDDRLLNRLADLGHRVLAHDLTLPGDPLPSVRVLVPGLCAMQGRTGTARFQRLCPTASAPVFPEPY